MGVVCKFYRIARNFRGLKFSRISRIGHTIRENINREIFIPGMPGVCEWDHTVLAKSGRGLGADATAKILSAKIHGQSAKILTREKF